MGWTKTALLLQGFNSTNVYMYQQGLLGELEAQTGPGRRKLHQYLVYKVKKNSRKEYQAMRTGHSRVESVGKWPTISQLMLRTCTPDRFSVPSSWCYVSSLSTFMPSFPSLYVVLHMSLGIDHP